MKTLLWLNRHNPHENQISELQRIFGEFRLIQKIVRIDPAPEVGVPQISEIMEEEGADEIVCSVPIQHLEGLVNSGLTPIRAIMVRTPSARFDGNNEREFDFEFLHFEQIHAVVYKANKL